jgi:hypothetical protein
MQPRASRTRSMSFGFRSKANLQLILYQGISTISRNGVEVAPEPETWVAWAHSTGVEAPRAQREFGVVSRLAEGPPVPSCPLQPPPAAHSATRTSSPPRSGKDDNSPQRHRGHRRLMTVWSPESSRARRALWSSPERSRRQALGMGRPASLWSPARRDGMPSISQGTTYSAGAACAAPPASQSG